MLVLYSRAIDYISCRSKVYETIIKFDRTKPTEYFNEILHGDGVMKVYIKDFNGDPKSPINNRLSGLFFEPTVSKKNKKAKISPYGDITLKVCPRVMFNENMNLYFADFYCMRRRDSHIVTLVLTQPDSAADEFCQTYLVQLDEDSNPFMHLTPTGDAVVITATGFRIEVLYCNDVHVSHLLSSANASMKSTKCKARHNGMMKSNGCPHCNIITNVTNDVDDHASNNWHSKLNDLIEQLRADVCLTE